MNREFWDTIWFFEFMNKRRRKKRKKRHHGEDDSAVNL